MTEYQALERAHQRIMESWGSHSSDCTECSSFVEDGTPFAKTPCEIAQAIIAEADRINRRLKGASKEDAIKASIGRMKAGFKWL